MKQGTPFRLQDIINLEYLFHLDKEEAPATLHKRDRQFACTHTAEKKSSMERIASWLSFRLKEEFPRAELRSPGAIFADAFRLVSVITIFSAIVMGALTGLAFFSYTGTTPVNVFQFLLLFIAPQLFFLALLIVWVLAAKLLPSIHIPTFYSLLLERGCKLLAARFSRKWQQQTTEAQRGSLAHAFALIKIHSSRYGSLFQWPLFSLFQGFGFVFNLALLGVSLLKIATCDLAFGWQSTIQFGDATIHKLASLLALPWSWLPGGMNLLPTLSEVAGSRIILKNGIYHLATADLTSWWPFLVMCLLVYGVFVRLLLLLFGWWMSRRLRTATPLNTPQCKALLQRMANPLVATQAKAETPFIHENQQKQNTLHTVQPPQMQAKSEPSLSAPLLVLAVIDICEQFANPQQEITEELQKYGYQPKTIIAFQKGYEEDQQLLQQLEQDAGQDILLLVEGWMVPLVSLLSYVGEIRRRIATDASITIALVGQPQESIFSPVKRKDFAIWQQKTETLADPYLHLTPLKGIEE